MLWQLLTAASASMPDCLQISRAERRIMVSEHFFLFFVVQEVLLHVSNPYFCADVLCTSLKQSPQASSFSKSLLSGRLTLCTAFHPASPGFCKVWRASLVFLGATTERFSFPRVSAERSSKVLGAPHSPTLQIRIYLQINHACSLLVRGSTHRFAQTAYLVLMYKNTQHCIPRSPLSLVSASGYG